MEIESKIMMEASVLDVGGKTQRFFSGNIIPTQSVIENLISIELLIGFELGFQS